MAAKPRPRTKKLVGPRGPRGKTGPPGASGDGAVKQLAAQMNEVLRELHIQMTRIGQIQLQLDRLASGEPPTVEREPTKRTN